MWCPPPLRTAAIAVGLACFALGASSPRTIVIKDPGGYIWLHQALGNLYAREDVQLVVVYCASACLDLLAQVPRERICLMPQAWIGWHRPGYGFKKPAPSYDMEWARGRDWIARGIYRECQR